MKYKLIGLDLDGTLLDSNYELKKGIIKIMKKCLAQKIKITFATGRLYKSFEKYVDQLHLSTEQISLNGGVVIDPNTRKIVMKEIIPSYIYKEIVNKVKKLGFPFVIFTPRDYYSEFNGDKIKKIENITNREINFINKAKELKNVVKIVAITKKNRELKKELDRSNVKVAKTGNEFIEIYNKHSSKRNGIEYIANKYDIKQDEILTIGDSENDIEMLQYSGKGVAVENALPEVKQKADDVVNAKNNKGVAEALTKYVL